MSSIRNSVLCGFSACFVFWSLSATAATVVSLNIPLQGTFIGSGTTESFNKLRLPDAGNPNFAFTFALPRDYINNSEVSVLLHLTVPSGTPCSAVLQSLLLTRSRGGVPVSEGIIGVTPSLTTNFTAAGTIAIRSFKINPSGTGLIPDQKKGDVIGLQLRRLPADISDTCATTLDVYGIEVRYMAP
jgi:hypothetical protein